VEYYPGILLGGDGSTKTTFRVSVVPENKIVTRLIKISLKPLPLHLALKFVIVNVSNITSRIFRNVVIQQHS
jgi:hypothetical protein